MLYLLHAWPLWLLIAVLLVLLVYVLDGSKRTTSARPRYEPGRGVCGASDGIGACTLDPDHAGELHIDEHKTSMNHSYVFRVPVHT